MWSSGFVSSCAEWLMQLLVMVSKLVYFSTWVGNPKIIEQTRKKKSQMSTIVDFSAVLP